MLENYKTIYANVDEVIEKHPNESLLNIKSIDKNPLKAQKRLAKLSDNV